jgi:hypothetical protein
MVFLSALGYFSAFHPDLVNIASAKGIVKSPMSDYQSSVPILSIDEILRDEIDRSEKVLCDEELLDQP